MIYHQPFWVNFTQSHNIIGKGPQLTRKDYEKYQEDLFSYITTNIMRAVLCYF